MTDKLSGWWTGKKYSDLGDVAFDTSWAAQALAMDVLEGGAGPVYEQGTEGALIGSIKEIQDKLLELGGRLIWDEPIWRTHKAYRSFLSWSDACVGMWGCDGDLEVRMVTTNPDLLAKLKVIFEHHIGPKASAGRAYVMISTDEGMKLTSIGVAAVPLERGNYNPDVIEDFDAVVADLKSKDPNGRLAVFDGDPGTGKTFMIKGLLAAVPNALFVVVPAHLIPELGSPGMVNALIETRRNKGDLPTVFLAEDADECLMSRDASNTNSVSALLNLGDGILGSMMDIRLVCTTNLRNDELDAAVVRPGRLSRKVHVGPLDRKVAEALFERLTGNKVKIDEKLTLAQVYSLARDAGWKPVQVAKQTIGFTSSVSPHVAHVFESMGVDLDEIEVGDPIDDPPTE